MISAFIKYTWILNLLHRSIISKPNWRKMFSQIDILHNYFPNKLCNRWISNEAITLTWFAVNFRICEKAFASINIWNTDNVKTTEYTIHGSYLKRYDEIVNILLITQICTHIEHYFSSWNLSWIRERLPK